MLDWRFRNVYSSEFNHTLKRTKTRKFGRHRTEARPETCVDSGNIYEAGALSALEWL